MDLEHLEKKLEGIRHLLSHLHGEVTTLEVQYSEVLHVLREVKGEHETDDLTGLLRRRSFFSKWNDLISGCQRKNDSCGMLMIDIDHFKQVNDTHGHATGDEVLKRVSEYLKTFSSPNCLVGRYGGEEFAVAIRGSDAEILGIAEMIRRGVERLHGPIIDSNGKPSRTVEWKCTLSVGMASAHKVGFDAPRLLQAADQALYRAKRSGRNRVAAA